LAREEPERSFMSLAHYVEAGRVVEEGTDQELIERGGASARLAERQIA
jgi:ABC-type multidrug transport system fused ATPase/permease subunit